MRCINCAKIYSFLWCKWENQSIFLFKFGLLNSIIYFGNFNFKLGLEDQFSHKLGLFCQVGPVLEKVLGHLSLNNNRAPYMPSTVEWRHSPPTKRKIIKPLNAWAYFQKVKALYTSNICLLEGA